MIQSPSINKKFKKTALRMTVIGKIGVATPTSRRY